MNTVFIYVCGILTRPGESENWTGRAVTWTHLNTQFHAEKVEYFTGPVSRVTGQPKRVMKLAKTMAHYMNRQWPIVLCAHSNGCDVLLKAMALLQWPDLVKGIHLISAACEADFDKNGLNGFRGDLKVYIAERDFALGLAATFFGELLGYGALGKIGPIGATQPHLKIRRRQWDHSDWFSVENFDQTMMEVTGPYSCLENRLSNTATADSANG